MSVKIRRILKYTFLILAGIFLGWIIFEYITFPNIARLREQNPETSSMIEARIREAQARGEQPKRIQNWVSLDKISTNVQRAVLAGEDTNFVTHNGFDYQAIQRAWEEAQREAAKEAKEEGDDQSSWIPPMPSFKRGASTISQQLAKNLFSLRKNRFSAKGARPSSRIFLSAICQSGGFWKFISTSSNGATGFMESRRLRSITSKNRRRI